MLIKLAEAPLRQVISDELWRRLIVAMNCARAEAEPDTKGGEA